MALKTQSSFAKGELDPALHERTTLQAFDVGLKTARNVMVGRTGRIVSPNGRKFFIEPKYPERRCLLYSPMKSNVLLEWGHQYVRVYGFGTFEGVVTPEDEPTLLDEHSHSFTEDDLDLIQFDSSKMYTYIFLTGSEYLKLYHGIGGGFVSTIFLPSTPSNATVTDNGAPAGYDVEYAATQVTNGEESNFFEFGAGENLPIASGQSNTLSVRSNSFPASGLTEMKFYRRPEAAGAYGYIGSTTEFTLSGGNYFGVFEDIGGAADYSHGPPQSILTYSMRPQTGTIYQQRMIIQDWLDPEGIIASRPGYQNNFTRDFPYNADSAVKFKTGTSGNAYVLRLIDNDGLISFTTNGIYVNVGGVGPTNLSFDKKGNWVINVKIPPIALPGGVLFVDSRTNAIRQLLWSTEAASYSGDDISVYSNHLFLKKTIVSWAFQEGDPPILWVVFDDGTWASLTYEREQEMRAWTRHDYSNDDINVEYACGTGVSGISFFLVEKDGNRTIEVTLPRYGKFNSPTDIASECEPIELYGKTKYSANMISMVSYDLRMNGSLTNDDVFTLTNPTPGDWSGPLTLTCGTSGIFLVGTFGAVGKVMRFFNENGQAIDLEVTARANNNEVTVQPSIPLYEEGSDESLQTTFSDFLLFDLSDTFGSLVREDDTIDLSHLEGENVSILADGEVISSPLNDVANYPNYAPTGGSITLPKKYAIVHVGRPVVSDIETLDVATVEQRPTLLESKTVNKLYVKVNSSQGFFVGNKFPADNKVQGMQKLDELEIVEDTDGVNTECPPPYRSVRHEVIIPGDWKSNGRVCIRNVDPVHFEVLSISTDLEDQRR